MYDKSLLCENTIAAIVSLTNWLQNYWRTIHRRTAVKHTTRKVEEASEAITRDDFKAYQNSKGVKTAIKLLGEAIEK